MPAFYLRTQNMLIILIIYKYNEIELCGTQKA
jgi:hypothetical protein